MKITRNYVSTILILSAAADSRLIQSVSKPGPRKKTVINFRYLCGLVLKDLLEEVSHEIWGLVDWLVF